MWRTETSSLSPFVVNVNTTEKTHEEETVSVQIFFPFPNLLLSWLFELLCWPKWWTDTSNAKSVLRIHQLSIVCYTWSTNANIVLVFSDDQNHSSELCLYFCIYYSVCACADTHHIFTFLPPSTLAFPLSLLTNLSEDGPSLDIKSTSSSVRAEMQSADKRIGYKSCLQSVAALSRHK